MELRVTGCRRAKKKVTRRYAWGLGKKKRKIDGPVEYVNSNTSL